MEMSSVKKESSVEVLMTQLYKKGFLKEIDGNEPINLMNQAKAMHEEECISFYVKGCKDTYGIDEGDDATDTRDAKAYYSKKFGGGK